MTWNIVFFLLALLLSVSMVALATLQVNAFEKKVDDFLSRLNARYDLEKLKRAIEEEKRIKTEKAKARNRGAN
jgi:hypothetical protein